MVTYGGQQDWRPYILQFTRMANRYGWIPEESVDRLVDWLRNKALYLYGSLNEQVRDTYDLLVAKLDQHFGKKDPPSSVRQQ